MEPVVVELAGIPGAAPSAGSQEPGRLRVDGVAWSRGELDWVAFDGEVDRLAWRGAFAVEVMDAGGSAGPEALQAVAAEVELRCQRWSGRRNAGSAGDWFTDVLARHRELHPLAKPLVWADYRHVLDVWQWTLRIAPDAGAAVQVAALFHDIERVASEADARYENAVADYDAYKVRHGEASAAMTEELLAGLRLPSGVRERTVGLVAAHDRPAAAGGDDPEIVLLQDADALSFFALNSPGYLRYYGPEPTRRKVAWTLARLSPCGRPWLPRLRLVPEIAALLAAESPSGTPVRGSGWWGSAAGT